MPNLEDLLLEMALGIRTDEAHTDFGRALKTFENKIDIHLSVLCNKYIRESIIDLLCPFGFLPYVVDLELRDINCSERGASQLKKLRGIEFKDYPEFRGLKSQDIKFTPFLWLMHPLPIWT